jgi:general secretion pathway protein G
MKPMNTMQRRRTLRTLQGGFSLIEILIVVGLIALIAGMVARQVFGGRDTANFRIAKTQLTSLAADVEQFEMDTGGLPQRLEDLVKEPGNAKGWLGPYAKEADLKDPWNTAIEYRVPGKNGPFELISLGGDRKPGGSSTDADLSSND